MNIPGRLRSEGEALGSANAENLLKEITTKKWTGYLWITCRNLEFLLFFEHGDPTHGFRAIEDQLFSFSHLSDILYSLNGGTLRFFETSPGALQVLLDMKFGSQIYGDLHTAFTDLKNLFTKLEQEKLTGSVEIDVSSFHCFVLMEDGLPDEVVCSQQEEGEIFSVLLEKVGSESGVIRVYERRDPPTVLSPDPEEIFSWSSLRRLKLEFAFGQLGKEFEDLLDQKLTISQILDVLCVDFVEIADMYTYLSAKGYITTKKG